MKRTESELSMARRIAEAVADEGGRAYFVGGYVRDGLRGRPSKDIDLEIHDLAPAALEALLDGLGERLSLGESFGIYALKGFSIDIAMPRKERLRGRGHKDFDIFVDPFIGVEKAAARRDFTINAMLRDVLSGELLDPFGGEEDLRRGLLRHVNDDSFREDPLRVLRGAQFAARFGFSLAPETLALCRTMPLDALASERVEEELKKALLKAPRPSVFFEILREADRLSVWFPELEALIGVRQSPKHHAEGDVWTHTMLVLDECAAARDESAQPFALMLAALCHDFGKPLCSEEVDGDIRSYGHETAGLVPAGRFLRRLSREIRLSELVLNLVELHMKPNALAAQRAGVKATNRMFDRALDPEALLALALADDRGKRPAGPAEQNEAFLRERLALYREYMARPYVVGRDLVAAGLRPSPAFSELLAHAHKLRLAGVDKDSALKQTLALARQTAAEDAKTEKENNA